MNRQVKCNIVAQVHIGEGPCDLSGYHQEVDYKYSYRSEHNYRPLQSETRRQRTSCGRGLTLPGYVRMNPRYSLFSCASTWQPLSCDFSTAVTAIFRKTQILISYNYKRTRNDKFLLLKDIS